MENENNKTNPGTLRRSFIKTSLATLAALGLSFLPIAEDPKKDKVRKIETIPLTQNQQEFLDLSLVDPDPTSTSPQLVLAAKEIDREFVVGIATYRVPAIPDSALWTLISESNTPDVFYFASVDKHPEQSNTRVILKNKISSVRGGGELELRRGGIYHVEIREAQDTSDNPSFDHLPIVQGSFVIS